MILTFEVESAIVKSANVVVKDCVGYTHIFPPDLAEAHNGRSNDIDFRW